MDADLIVVYSAASEREFIRSMQREPAPVVPVPGRTGAGRPKLPHSLTLRGRILALLAAEPSTWFTSSDVYEALSADRRSVMGALRDLAREGKVRSEQLTGERLRFRAL